MTVIHIIAPFINANGGDWRAIEMYMELCKQAEVHLWSQNPVHSELASYPIEVIQPYQGKAPFGGTLYICGTATAVGHWYEQATFERIVLIHNLCDQDIFYRSMHRLSINGSRHIEIAYASKMVQDSIGLPGEILYPMPHPDRFKPLARTRDENQPFTIGRISTDKISKHHYQDIPLYKQLSAQGIHIKIVGGTCLKPWLDGEPNIELLPIIPQGMVPAMLNTFDCFYYRVSSNVKEAFGIVIAEAFLSGLPVVCYNEGGYTEFIKGKKNGFLFESNKEAIDTINQIRSASTRSLTMND
jgi:glycosyltransferase involved in cell wall biosynthesis